jgi:Fic/DOC family
VVSTLLFTDDAPRQTLSNRLRQAQIRRLAPGIYTSNVTDPLEAVVRNEWPTLAGRAFPHAVVSDRSAVTGGPTNGVLYLVHDARARNLTLPGLTISARQGAAPLAADLAVPGGLHQASRARALAENARDSRASKTHQRRTLDRTELATWIDRLCRLDGEERLRSYRTEAEALATEVGTTTKQFAALAQLIGAALGTQHADSQSAALTARQRGVPFDSDRLVRLDLLATALRSSAPQSRSGVPADAPGFAVQAFFESYFSNYIEGTTFTVGEARSIVFDAVNPTGRTADGHDVTGTYQIVGNALEIARTASNASDFVELLRARHATLMAGRPELQPGSFKLRANQAGSTLFVEPDLVFGTLVEGFRRVAELDTAWERAVYVGFLVAEVHPFTDGNGRMSRVMMNAELVAGNQAKIIVPTGFRSDYLGALRRLSRSDDPSVFIKAMRFLHDYTSQIDWTSLGAAENDLRETHAFEEDDDGRRLRLLRPTRA